MFNLFYFFIGSLYIIFGTFDYFIYIDRNISLFNYIWIVNTVIFPFLSIFFYLFILLYQYFKKEIKDYNIHCNYKPILLIAFAESIESIVFSYTMPFISIFLLQIIDKITLIINFAISYKLLNSRYHWNHYVGMIIRCIGVLIGAIPIINNQQEKNYLAISFFIIISIIKTLVNIYRENYIKSNKLLNLTFFNFLLMIFTFLTGLITIPFIFIPLQKYSIKTNEFPQYVSNTFKCLYKNENTQENDNCNYSLILLLINIKTSNTVNQILAHILKNGSNILNTVILSLKSPLIIVSGYFIQKYNLIKFNSKYEIDWSVIVSLILLFIGSIIYGYKAEYKLSKNPALDEKLLSLSS